LLKLRNIVKDYDTGSSKVRALDGISLDFRESEFVSILGPSGCGKTTLLNIIGGLDQYTSGDLIINERSTKLYRDADWDTYRNHSIGFVFQSYNLIPHQTVLANVELALTLSGISPKERRARAMDALRQVGLADQVKKKPNQMSGGQMQRVAIARALVNDPDILLADEPTGALDTQTSVQIMEILRSISKKKLIIMVTHNPDLAQEYSSRIIRVLDGRVVDDTNPYLPNGEFDTVQEKAATDKKEQKKRLVADKKALKAAKASQKKAGKVKKSMSFFTALSLSLNNLMTKKARTFMTSFAGSIGIIGIALILSVSTGVNNYIDSVQRDTLSTYPLTIQKESQDLSAMLSAMTEVKKQEQGEIDPNKIYVDDSMGAMLSSMKEATSQNNLVKFKQYILDNYSKIADAVSDIQYTYDFDLQVFNADGTVQVNPSKIFDSMGDAFAGMTEMMELSGSSSMFSVMSEMINNQDVLEEQYELVGDGSHWPTNENEIVLVVDKNNQISKMTLYMLGHEDFPQDELEEIITELMKPDGTYESSHMVSYDISDFIGREFWLLNTSDFFVENTARPQYPANGKTYPVWMDLRDPLQNPAEFDQAAFVKANGTKLVISAVVRPREGVAATSISGTIGYTNALTKKILAMNQESAVINQQKETPAVNVLTGLPFAKTVYTKDNIDELISKIDDATMESFYANITKMILNDPTLSSQLVINSPESFMGFFPLMPADYQQAVLAGMLEKAKTQPDALNGLLSGLGSSLPDISVTANNLLQLLPVLPENDVLTAVGGMISLCGEDFMQGIYRSMTEGLRSLTITDEIFTILLKNNFIPDDRFEQLVETLYNMAPQTDATLASVLHQLGDAAEADPMSINFFAKDFESKEVIEKFIADYNKSVGEEDQIQYTDMIGILMSSISTIINAISYVLIAFVAISLVVSSIMIGIITYISVLERTKEIGILRAIGASKRDIRRVFNAETLIVGFVAGLIGILTTLFFNFIINIILLNLTGLPTLKASLPIGAAIILVAISMFLTFIAGLFPSGFAAKRNPVEALRSE